MSTNEGFSDEENTPFEMPDLLEYCSNDVNELSIIGRVLNPDHQKVSDLILELPRNWDKVGRIREIALSRERFEFIFRSEHD